MITTPYQPQRMARLIGALLLATVLFGALGQTLQGLVVVPGDAAMTAMHVTASANALWRVFMAYMVEMCCQVATTALLYELLRPVNPGLSLMAALFSATGIVVKIVSRIVLVLPVFILAPAGALDSLPAEQRQAFAMFAFTVNAQGAGMATLFFGAGAVVSNLLIWRSGFLPRWLGLLGVICGAGWLAFIDPPFGQRWSGPIIMLGVGGALVKIGWFLLRGIDETAWRASARRLAHVADA